MFMMGGESCGGNSVRHISAVYVVYMKLHSVLCFLENFLWLFLLPWGIESLEVVRRK